MAHWGCCAMEKKNNIVSLQQLSDSPTYRHVMLEVQ